MSEFDYIPGAIGGLFMFAIFGFFLLIPIIKILYRTGHSPFWSLLLFFPLAAYFGLWVLAFKKWPAQDVLQAPPERS